MFLLQNPSSTVARNSGIASTGTLLSGRTLALVTQVSIVLSPFDPLMDKNWKMLENASCKILKDCKNLKFQKCWQNRPAEFTVGHKRAIWSVYTRFVFNSNLNSVAVTSLHTAHEPMFFDAFLANSDLPDDWLIYTEFGHDGVIVKKRVWLSCFRENVRKIQKSSEICEIYDLSKTHLRS